MFGVGRSMFAATKLAIIAGDARVEGVPPGGGAGVMIGGCLYSARDRDGGAGVLNSLLPPQLLACYYLCELPWLAVWRMCNFLRGCVMFLWLLRRGS